LYPIVLTVRSVSIATDYGLDGPGSNRGGDEIFHPSRPALGPPPLTFTPTVRASKGQIIYWLQILIPLAVGIKLFCLVVLFVVIFSGSWPRLTL